ncbi:hypothetical protein IJG79_01400 [Candidatus Saccharibacteria bacterium]|nr:hypothetical protein [Candidatus Saccharibacteria bacterium]
MKNLKEDLRLIYREHRGLLMLMILLAVLSLIFLVFSLLTLSPSSAIVKVGYGDIGSFSGEGLAEMRTAGGYRDGGWASMLTFPVLAVIFGFLHNLLAVKLFKRRGENTAKAFIILTIALLLGATVVAIRLLGEN